MVKTLTQITIQVDYLELNYKKYLIILPFISLSIGEKLLSLMLLSFSNGSTILNENIIHILKVYNSIYNLLLIIYCFYSLYKVTFKNKDPYYIMRLLIMLLLCEFVLFKTFCIYSHIAFGSLYSKTFINTLLSSIFDSTLTIIPFFIFLDLALLIFEKWKFNSKI